MAQFLAAQRIVRFTRAREGRAAREAAAVGPGDGVERLAQALRPSRSAE